GKVALITGGDSGIGRGIAIRLARDGADVAIVYRSDEQGANEVIGEIASRERRGFAIRADIGRVADAQRAVRDSVANLGRLDILVNNAGIEKAAAFWEVTEADYDAVMTVNLKGVFFATQAMVQHLREAKH